MDAPEILGRISDIKIYEAWGVCFAMLDICKFNIYTSKYLPIFPDARRYRLEEAE